MFFLIQFMLILFVYVVDVIFCGLLVLCKTTLAYSDDVNTFGNDVDSQKKNPSRFFFTKS